MNTSSTSCPSKSSPAGRWRTAFLPCLLLLPTPSDASPLLWLRESHEGLLAEPAEAARIVPPEHVPASGRPAAAHWKTLQRHHFAVHGRHPPVHYFFCTVYYTPRESGFTAARGFDTTREKRSALGSRTFPASFLRGVVMEGYGRLADPGPSGKSYVRYSGSWGYGAVPLGNRNNPLQDRRSAAVHRGHPLLGKGTSLRILDPFLHHAFGTTEFETADTGGGLFRSQIDLYWGEDDPLGPFDLFRPASCPVAVRWIVPVIVGP